MKDIIKNLQDINKPIVHIAFGFFFCSLAYGIWDYSKALAIFINLCFYIFLYKCTNKSFLFVILLFQGLTIGFNINYFNYNISLNDEIRIVEKSQYNTIGEVKGRRFYLTNNIKTLNVGEKITAKGVYLNKEDKQKGILGEIKINSFKKSEGDFLYYLWREKSLVSERLSENLGIRKSGLITSISYGDKSLLDREDNEDMKYLGVVHAISVSGMHVALIFFLINRFLSRGLSLAITTVYVIFTGMAFSSIRAIIMLGVLAYSVPLNKKYNPLGAISLSAIILIMWKPYVVFDIGFLLSYSATIGIILFNDKINKKLYKLPKIIREGISLAISSQILSFPFLALVFKSVSINLFLGNIILIPIINLILIMGNLLPLFLNISWVFDFLSYTLMKLINILDYFMDLLYRVSLPMITMDSHFVKFYLILLIVFYFYKKGHRKMIYLPLIYILVIGIEIYSPFLTIEYFREGALGIKYRGSGQIITNKRNIDLGKIKGESKINSATIDGEFLKINENIEFKRVNKDFILIQNNKNQILLKLSKEGKNEGNYDIIDFNNRKINKIIVIRNKIYKIY
ncbi:MAG: ComEC/Rec2 family competence protein [Clostridium sp.]